MNRLTAADMRNHRDEATELADYAERAGAPQRVFARIRALAVALDDSAAQLESAEKATRERDEVGRLIEAIADHQDVTMKAGDRPPVVSMEWQGRIVAGSRRISEFAAVVSGQVIASGSGFTVARAASGCRLDFERWANDQQPRLEAGLAASILKVRGERAAGSLP